MVLAGTQHEVDLVARRPGRLGVRGALGRRHDVVRLAILVAFPIISLWLPHLTR